MRWVLEVSAATSLAFGILQAPELRFGDGSPSKAKKKNTGTKETCLDLPSYPRLNLKKMKEKPTPENFY